MGNKQFREINDIRIKELEEKQSEAEQKKHINDDLLIKELDQKNFLEEVRQPQIKKTDEKNKMSVDELLTFIEKKDEKGKSKKNKNKKNEKQSKNLNSSNIEEKDIESELENFKTRLRLDSIPNKNLVKIKPFITQDWINSISRLT